MVVALGLAVVACGQPKPTAQPDAAPQAQTAPPAIQSGTPEATAPVAEVAAPLPRLPSPEGASVAILNSSKAYAILQARDFVTPEDIKTVALPVLRHRIMLNPDKEMEGVSADDVVRQIIDKIEVPR